MNWKVTTEPVFEPLTLDEAKRHLRLSLDDECEDIDVIELIKEARDWCENYLDFSICQQTITLNLDNFGSDRAICLPQSNLISVDSVKYTDSDEVQQTVSTSVYGVDVGNWPGRIFLKQNQEWPSGLIDQINAVEIIYKAGWPTQQRIPGCIKRAMKLLLSHWNSNREATISGISVEELPLGAKAALDKYRVYSL